MFKRYLPLLFLLFPLFSIAQFEPNYGISLNLNYPTIGKSLERFSGRGLYSFGMFYQRPISPYHTNRLFNSFDFMVEPSVNQVSYRDVNSDNRITNTYLDLGTYLNYVPDRMSEDFRIMLGLRPSTLMFTNSDSLVFGAYKTIDDDPANLNTRGRIDFCGVLGINLSLGNVASVELKYIHSFTNQNTATHYKGRPSSFEFGIRLSAIKIRDKLIHDEKTLSQELRKRSAGTLLVMLESPNEKLIQQLVEERKIEDADLVRGLQRQTNKFIVAQFRKNFSFCRVEFFMDQDAYKVGKGMFKDVFLDDDMKVNSTITVDSVNYFLGSFIEDISDYTRNLNYGLFIYDNNFKQLSKPYNTSSNYLGNFRGGDPLNYFRRVKTMGYFQEDFGRVIRKLNDRLINLKN